MDEVQGMKIKVKIKVKTEKEKKKQLSWQAEKKKTTTVNQYMSVHAYWSIFYVFGEFVDKGNLVKGESNLAVRR